MLATLFNFILVMNPVTFYNNNNNLEFKLYGKRQQQGGQT